VNKQRRRRMDTRALRFEVWKDSTGIGSKRSKVRELFPASAALSRARLQMRARALGAGNRCPGAILLPIARSNLHRWPSRRAWCKSESKVRLARFCLAERQVSPSARSIAPRSFPLVIPVPGGESLSACFCCCTPPLSRTRTRAQNFALFPYIRVLVRRTYISSGSGARAIDR